MKFVYSLFLIVLCNFWLEVSALCTQNHGGKLVFVTCPRMFLSNEVKDESSSYEDKNESPELNLHSARSNKEECFKKVNGQLYQIPCLTCKTTGSNSYYPAVSGNKSSVKKSQAYAKQKNNRRYVSEPKFNPKNIVDYEEFEHYVPSKRKTKPRFGYNMVHKKKHYSSRFFNPANDLDDDDDRYIDNNEPAEILYNYPLPSNMNMNSRKPRYHDATTPILTSTKEKIDDSTTEKQTRQGTNMIPTESNGGN